MKSILLPAANDDFMESRLQVALDIVRRFDGHLTLVQAQPYQAYMSVDMFGGTHFMAQAFTASAEMLTKTREELDKRLDSEGISWDWQIYDGAMGAVIADAARLADIVVMSLGETGKTGANPFRALVGDVALATRTPVLAIPNKISAMAFDRAMIAYDGGEEAVNAIRQSLPMLQQTEAVSIFEIEEKESDFPITDAAIYLSRHGIESEIITDTVKERTIEECLFDKAAQYDANYIVMGAYGHSRLRETILGGVTRYLMGETKVPLLLAH